MFNYFKKWRQQRMKLKLWQREQRRQHVAWTPTITCFYCQSRSLEEANFCSQCGVPFARGILQQQTTGPLTATERPLLAYRRHLHPGGPNTQIHRAVHIPNSKEFKTDAMKRIEEILREDQ